MRPAIPELPPEYEVAPGDEGWIVKCGDGWLDDEEWGEPQPTRDDAVDLAWKHWRCYGGSEWVAFIDAMRGHR